VTPRLAWAPLAAVGAVSAVGGVLVAVSPAVGFAGAVAVSAGAAALAYAAALPRVFLRAVGAILLGYAMFGRGFAYVGVAPLFVGEATLLLGLAALAATARRDALPSGAVPVLLLAFIACGALRTAPFLPAYGVDALRDAVLWGYGLYALAVAAALLHTGWLPRVPAAYQAMTRALVCWVPIAWAVTAFKLEAIPRVPGSTTPMLSFKAGDAAVHLAGGAAFVLGGLASWSRGDDARSRRLETAYWIAWAVCFCVVASFNRSGMLAIAAAGGVTVALGTRLVRRRTARAASVAVALAAAFVTLDAVGLAGAIRPPNEARAMSVEQMKSNFASVFGGEGDKQELEGTKRWRLMWWTRIVGYTVHGPYFWTGKGFGVNLANDDGFQVDAEETLRSPHNGHISVLARMGVPGAALWAALQLAYAASMLHVHRRARRRGAAAAATLSLWLLAYWAAAMVNTSFDVYLEGPMGGIWFWALFGVGLALIEEERRRAPPAAARAAWAPR